MFKKSIIFLLLLSITAPSHATVFEWGNPDSVAPTEPAENKWNGTDEGWLLDHTSLVFSSETLPVTRDGLTTHAQTGIFIPGPTTYGGVDGAMDGDKLVITNDIKVKGDIEIRFEGNEDETVHEAFEIDIGTTISNSPISIAAYNDATTEPTEFSQLIFNVKRGKTIVVNLYNDLSFHSADRDAAYDDPDTETPGDETGVSLPFYVTFRGAGKTVFRMPSGKRIYFGPPTPGRTADPSYDEEGATDGLSEQGVNVQVFMEQSNLDIYGSESVALRSQVVFEKWSYAADSVNTDLSLDTWVTFGQKSSFVFLSDNFQGVSEVWTDVNGDNDIDLGEPMIRPGYGSVAFDPSNSGTGRLVLEIARGQKPSGNDFTDGGFNVYGALLAPVLPSTDRHPAVVFNEDFRTGVYFNQRAGIRAVMRIVDDVARVDRGAAWSTRTVDDRRGLVVLNHNNSIPHFANNYDRAASIDECKWAHHNSYQPGFVLGVNGEIEVGSGLFLDYMANNVNKTIGAAHADVVGTHTADVVKKHNPAALYTDFLPTFYRTSGRQTDQWGTPISDLVFIGHTSSFGAHASILLLGDAAMYVRAVAPYTTDTVTQKTGLRQVKNEGHYHLVEITGTDPVQVGSYVMGIGQYDRSHVPILDDDFNYKMQSTDPEGAHAIDIEGALTISSGVGDFGEPAAGVFKVPSVEIDHTGREIYYETFGDWTPSYVIERPLPARKWFATYDISSIMCNADFNLNNVTWVHDDVTRNLDVPAILPHPYARARPHVVGGELALLSGWLTGPRLSLNDTTIACHESLVVTGVNLTVNERLTLPTDDGAVANNTARIICYNRGRDYDISGNGRVIQLGSQGNAAADGTTTNDLYSSANLNIYRSGPTSQATSVLPTTIQLKIETDEVAGVGQDEKGLHMLYLANDSQVHLGWPTLIADSGYTPDSFTSDILDLLVADDPKNKEGFRFNAYETGFGNLHFSGGPFFIGAGDSVEVAPPDRPIPGSDVGGVVYVNHGGKLSLESNVEVKETDLLIDTTVARRIASTVEASGQVSLPRDQAYFLANGGQQSYDVDFTVDKQLSGDLAEHVMVRPDDAVHIFSVQDTYPDEDDEVFEQTK